MVTFVVVVSESPLTSTFDSTSTLTFSPSTDSESATEAALSSAVCRLALASRAVAAFASLAAFETRGFFTDFAGLAFLEGEPALGLPLGFGVEAREVSLGGGRRLLSFAVNLNFGGGEIVFPTGSSTLATGVSSRRAAIQATIPYSSASSIAKAC